MVGTQDLIVGLALILFFFGAKRLPEIARSLGKSMQEFKKGVSGDPEKDAASEPVPPAAVTTVASRSCSGCKAPLDVAWTHCPRCGTAAPA